LALSDRPPPPDFITAPTEAEGDGLRDELLLGVATGDLDADACGDREAAGDAGTDGAGDGGAGDGAAGEGGAGEGGAGDGAAGDGATGEGSVD
jgi:hypothetical protein